MRYYLNKKGSMLAVSCMVLFIIVSIVLCVNELLLSSLKVMEDQNKKDAHVLSVLGLYSDTVNEVSWANEQLKKIGLLSSALVICPQLAGLAKMIELASKGLQAYQDLLLAKLELEAPIIDLNLRRSNGLNMMPGRHYMRYRRRPPLNLVFVSIPGLIEFDHEMFNTVCVRHSSGLIHSYGCIDSKDYSGLKKTWFAPTKTTWGVVIKHAY